MPNSASTSVVISGSGLWTPEYIVTNDELVTAYNAWAEEYNTRHAAAIGAGERNPRPCLRRNSSKKPPVSSSAMFI